MELEDFLALLREAKIIDPRIQSMIIDKLYAPELNAAAMKVMFEYGLGPILQKMTEIEMAIDKIAGNERVLN